MGPTETETRQDPIVLRNAVLERAFVEGHRWKVAQSRVHAVLDLEADRPKTETYQTLKQALVQASLGGLLAHDDRPELAVVTDKNHVLGAFENRDQCFWLRGLGSLIYQDLSEFDVPDAAIKRSNASRADNIRSLNYLVFSLLLQIFQLVLLLLGEFTLFLLEFNQLLHLCELASLQMLYLLVE